MNIEIHLQVMTPKWSRWRCLSAVKLVDAILLSVDVCPNWYQGYIKRSVSWLSARSADYPPNLPDYEIRSITEVYEAVENEIQSRLDVARSWSHKANWIIGHQDLMPEELKIDSWVDLQLFIQSAGAQMMFKELPVEFLNIAKPSDHTIVSDKDSNDEKLTATADWIVLGRNYAKEYMESYRGKNYSYGTQEEVAKKIYRYLCDHKIYTPKGTVPSIEYIVRNLLREGKWWKENHFWTPPLD